MNSVLVDRSPLNFTETAAASYNGVVYTFGSFNSTFSLNDFDPPSANLSSHSSIIPRLNLPRVRQPPLLPLPSVRFASASSPRKKSKGHQKMQTKPMSSLIPEAKDIIVPLQRMAKEGRELDEEKYLESVYSKSPPPSSLPLPSFALRKPPEAGVSVPIAGGAQGVAAGGGGGGVDAGATDDLRRLLRL